MIYVGIDPGLKGAIAVLKPDGACLRVYDMPITCWTEKKKKHTALNSIALYGLISGIAGSDEPIHWLIEQPQMRTRMSIKDATKAWYGVGLVDMAIIAVGGMPYKVEAAEWKKAAGVTSNKKTSLAVARSLWGRDVMPLEKHEGRAEALLIAEYARGKMRKGEGGRA